MQILCVHVVSQKKLQLRGTPPLDPAGRLPAPDPQSSFMSPHNPVRSTPLPPVTIWHSRSTKETQSTDPNQWRRHTLSSSINRLLSKDVTSNYAARTRQAVNLPTTNLLCRLEARQCSVDTVDAMNFGRQWWRFRRKRWWLVRTFTVTGVGRSTRH